MRVGYIQMEPQFGRVRENVERAVGLLRGAEGDLFVLPELFNTGYVFQSKGEVEELVEDPAEGFTARNLGRIAEERSCYLVYGMAERSGREFYNSAVLLGPGGVVGVYRKTHLFKDEKLWFSPGDGEYEVWEIPGARVGIMICFDWFFPEVSRILALKGAQVICHPANLVLPWCQESMRTRCLENGVFAITANRVGRENRGGTDLAFTGGSQVVSPQGEVIVRAPWEGECVRIVEIDPKAADDKWVTERNNIFEDRRRNLYGDLVDM